MSDLLKLMSLASVVLGPFASDKVPAMAPDLKPWALWISGGLATVAWIASNALLKGQRDLKAAWWLLIGGGAVMFVSTVAYFAINRFWIAEVGGWRDFLFELGIVVAYSAGFSGLTVAAVAGTKLTERK